MYILTYTTHKRNKTRIHKQFTKCFVNITIELKKRSNDIDRNVGLSRIEKMMFGNEIVNYKGCSFSISFCIISSPIPRI